MLDEASLQRGELKTLSKILFKMQSVKNNGAGVSIAQEIAKKLRKGQAKEAKDLVKRYKDEIRLYPEIQRFIHDMIYPIGYWDTDQGCIVFE